MKKYKSIFVLIALTGIVLVAQSLVPPPPGTYDLPPQAMSIRQSPPQIHHIWIKKLISPPPGATMQLSIDLDSSYVFEPVSDTIDIYWGDSIGHKITFYDNASHGDPNAGDGIYNAYLNESVAAFRAEMVNRDALLTANGGYISFVGHSGTEHGQGFSRFDFAGFDSGLPVEVHEGYTTFRFCNSIKRENSLFITDLSVVENGARTYNVATNTGNPLGKWTFGQLFKNMAGTSIPVKALLKSFVRPWTELTTVNGQVADRRGEVYNLLLKPWLEKAGASLPGILDGSNWESVWDQTGVTGDNLCRYAPFKLTAIVNRLDVRENTSYSLDVFNSGETRFIFTLVDYTTGAPPPSNDMDLRRDLTGMFFPGFVDWIGMNVIFEYGNVETSRCGIKSLAESWVNLSNLPLGSAPYLEALEQITDRVTGMSAAPGRINGSALNRIRTNEKILYKGDFSDTDLGHADFRWAHFDWEFRQFELDGFTHALEQKPVTNTPNHFFNAAENLSDHKYYICWRKAYLGPFKTRYMDPCSPVGAAEVKNLVNWVFEPHITKQILRGNHNMPKTYGGHYMTGASGLVAGEFVHYWQPNTEDNPLLQTRPDFKEVRHQLSLNTCEGCHNGETKTIFTHVRPLAYGKSARFWRPPSFVPDTTNGLLDNDSNARAGAPHNIYPNLYPEMGGKRTFQNVSAFLTGNSYTGVASSPSYADDHPSDANDNNLDGLFYVNDPSGDDVSDHRFGYNDLLRRRDDLCSLVNSPCETLSIFPLMTNIKFIPLPLGGH